MRGLRGSNSYVGCVGKIFLRGSNFYLRGSLRGSKFFTWVQTFFVGHFFLRWSSFIY